MEKLRRGEAQAGGAAAAREAEPKAGRQAAASDAVRLHRVALAIIVVANLWRGAAHAFNHQANRSRQRTEKIAREALKTSRGGAHV